MNIAIWGMGVSGVSALKALSKSNHFIYCINSGIPNSWKNFASICEFIDEKNFLAEGSEVLKYEFDQIILSPGIDRKSNLVAHFIENGVEVISEIELAFRQVKLPIVAITGTNGKTTTTTMISDCLKLSGLKVFTGGNIGIPFCDILDNDKTYDVAVLELSSFQLESLKNFKADIAIILNLSESHMERYQKVEDYVGAKLNIFNNQTTTDLAIAPKEFLPDGGVVLTKIKGIDLLNTKLVGEHHLDNLFCVQKVLEFFNVKNSIEIIEQFLENFGGVEYRLQNVGMKKDMTFYNDAKSTNPYSTISACEAMGEKDYSLIMGGKLRSEVLEIGSVLKNIKPKIILCFGDAAELLVNQLGQNHNVVKFENLESVFNYIWKERPASNIMFSPGFPSFDQYENYLARGRDFNRLFEQGSST